MDGQNQNPADASAQDASTPSPAVYSAPSVAAPQNSPSADVSSAVVMPHDTPLPIADAAPAAVTAASTVSVEQLQPPAVQTGFYHDPSAADESVPEAASVAEPLLAADTTERQEVSWTAAEFAPHPKTLNWYLALAGITLVVVALGYFIVRDIVTVVVLLICAGLFGYIASRSPRELEYTLDAKGITVGRRFYPYVDFNSFTIVELGSFSSIDFMPLKRFAPILSISYHHDNEPEILEVLTQHLPFVNRTHTMTDTLMHRIGF